jgi:predicted nucleic acid-binding protein
MFATVAWRSTRRPGSSRLRRSSSADGSSRFERVLQAASESRRSSYDCEFIALARELGVSLHTNDRKVLRGFPDVARPLTAG